MNIDKIEVNALAATPGPWKTTAATLGVYPDSMNFAIASVCGNSGPYQNYAANATHIANCDPDVILKMIAVVESARSLKDCKAIEGTYIFDKIFMELEDAFAALETL